MRSLLPRIWAGQSHHVPLARSSRTPSRSPLSSDMSSDRDWFNGWIGGYIDAASVPGLRTAILCGSSVWKGTSTSRYPAVAGWSYGGAPVALGDVPGPLPSSLTGAHRPMVWSGRLSPPTIPLPRLLRPADQLFYPVSSTGRANLGAGLLRTPTSPPRVYRARPLPSGVPKGGPFEARPSGSTGHPYFGGYAPSLHSQWAPPSAVSGLGGIPRTGSKFPGQRASCPVC